MRSSCPRRSSGRGRPWAGFVVLCTVATAAAEGPPEENVNVVRHYQTTEEYWTYRYRDGSSFAVGVVNETSYPPPPQSYNYRTGYLKNAFEAMSVSSVVDFGCGDGVQAFMMLEQVPTISQYLGLDISRLTIHRITTSTNIVADIKEIHPSRELDVEFVHYRGYWMPPVLRRQRRTFDLALSLQVIMHILEEDLYQSYMRMLFASSHAFVMIQNDNIPTQRFNHMHNRRFTDWVKQNATDWTLYSWTPVSQFCPLAVCNNENDAMWVYVRNDLAAI